MALLLTTPIAVGSLDTHDYTHVRIASILIDLTVGAIHIMTDEGWVDEDSVWHKGAVSRRREFAIYNHPQIGTPAIPAQGTEGEEGYVPEVPASDDYVAANPEWSTIILTEGMEGVRVYNQVAQHLYQWIIDKGYYAGTIE